MVHRRTRAPRRHRVKRVYVAGPMSGLPGWNFPAFHAAAARLRAQGFDVVNPAELDEQDDAPLGSKPWAFYLRRDIPELLACDAIALLPGWENSKGARLELHIATELGFEVVTLEPAAH
jgi:hypothetical protein